MGTATLAIAAEPPTSARSGLGIAGSAAHSWAPDAQLIYVENDESLDLTGDSPRWGYLYRSASLGRSRSYSVAKGKVVQASDLGLRFDAPAVAEGWLDSDEAVALAEAKAGAEFRLKHGGKLDRVVLMRSVIEMDQPDRTNWMVIFTAEGAPSLFVVVDASNGKVSRTWRG